MPMRRLEAVAARSPHRQPVATLPLSQCRHCVNTDRWYFQVFQSAPDLIRALLPGGGTERAGS